MSSFAQRSLAGSLACRGLDAAFSARSLRLALSSQRLSVALINRSLSASLSLGAYVPNIVSSILKLDFSRAENSGYIAALPL